MTIGRPTKLNETSADRIIEATAAGASRAGAAAAAGVHRSTLLDWLARGAAGEPGFSDFRDRLKKAEGEAELEMVDVVRKAATTGTWQAAAWWLERRRPRSYGRRSSAIETGPPTMSEEDAMTKAREHVRTLMLNHPELRADIASDPTIRAELAKLLEVPHDQH